MCVGFSGVRASEFLLVLSFLGVVGSGVGVRDPLPRRGSGVVDRDLFGGVDTSKYCVSLFPVSKWSSFVCCVVGGDGCDTSWKMVCAVSFSGRIVDWLVSVSDDSCPVSVVQ